MPGVRNVLPMVAENDHDGATISTAPAASDSQPPATRGARAVEIRPTARRRTEGSATRAMKRKIIGRADGEVGARRPAAGAVGRSCWK